jgi:hypothetical protein
MIRPTFSRLLTRTNISFTQACTQQFSLHDDCDGRRKTGLGVSAGYFFSGQRLKSVQREKTSQI